MPSRNHDQLDAHHAARLELSRQLQRFYRRLYDESRNAIDIAIANGEFGPGTKYPDASVLGRSITQNICEGVATVKPVASDETMSLSAPNTDTTTQNT